MGSLYGKDGRTISLGPSLDKHSINRHRWMLFKALAHFREAESARNFHGGSAPTGVRRRPAAERATHNVSGARSSRRSHGVKSSGVQRSAR